MILGSYFDGNNSNKEEILFLATCQLKNKKSRLLLLSFNVEKQILKVKEDLRLDLGDSSISSALQEDTLYLIENKM